TVREWAGKDPVRVIIDRKLKLPLNASVFDGSAKTLVFTANEDIKARMSYDNINYFRIDFSKEIATQICGVLYKNNIQSLIVEGGTQTLQTFIDTGLWDAALIFSGNGTFGR